MMTHEQIMYGSYMRAKQAIYPNNHLTTLKGYFHEMCIIPSYRYSASDNNGHGRKKHL